MANIDKLKIENAVRDIIEAIGDDPNSNRLKDTPNRVARMYEEILGNVGEDPAKELSVFYEEEHDEMIIIKDIPLYSMCEHHLLPFIGKASVIYIPTNGKITGLSKVARLVDNVSKRPQLQERVTKTIADTLRTQLNAQGVMVIIEAEHLCMTMRGIKKPGSKTVTSAVRGVFENDPAARAEALSLIK